MKKFRNEFYKFYPILYIILAFIGYFRSERLLLLLSTVAMFNIASESMSRASSQKIKIDIRTAIDNDGHSKPVNIWPIYIFSFIFILLGVLQNTNTLHFSKMNNLLLSLVSAVYLFYTVEKAEQANKEYERVKQDYIKEHGQEAWDKSEREHENFMKELEEKFFKDK